MGANPVNPAEPLDNPDRIPVDVVIDQVVTILEILTFRNTIGGNHHIDVLGRLGKDLVALFGKG